MAGVCVVTDKSVWSLLRGNRAECSPREKCIGGRVDAERSPGEKSQGHVQRDRVFGNVWEVESLNRA